VQPSYNDSLESFKRLKKKKTWSHSWKLSCVEIEGGWLFVAEKNGQGRSRNGGGGESRAPGHKLNITNKLTDRIIPMVNLSVKISCHHMIFLLESFVITSIMSFVYIDESFSLRYSWMNFTIGIILSVMLYVKLTRHRIACLFLFLLFSLRFSRYIP